SKDFKSRDLLHLQNFESWELEELLKMASGFKHGFTPREEAKGKVIGLIFEKPSARTRVSL
ncbi:MAG: ornithine carbamoyltransferase, partial [Nitrososphaeria archaeon]|nr:ornithine carbamoyltransferase [Nitrososphaeria archaeon]